TRLLLPVLRARTLLCLRKDRQQFEQELDRVLRENDPNPSLRLENAAAKRRARRYLTSRVVDAECFAPSAP
ncbi:MAG TPA: TRAP transporter TatT component family protein, partial [Polyangiaceae bacterium]|nr:TRAP transporter TatT component family protein [Polyangiaceae bacterium]